MILSPRETPNIQKNRVWNFFATSPETHHEKPAATQQAQWEIAPSLTKTASGIPYGRNGEPLTLHKYLYANGNPAMFTDPSGMFGLIQVSVAVNMQTQFAQLDKQRVSAQAGQTSNGLMQVVNRSGRFTNNSAKRVRDMLPNKVNFETHQIIEKRFLELCKPLKNLFGSPGNMPSVILDKVGHQAITNAWRKALEYGGGKAVTPQRILQIAKDVYKDHPTLLRSCEEILSLL